MREKPIKMKQLPKGKLKVARELLKELKEESKTRFCCEMCGAVNKTYVAEVREIFLVKTCPVKNCQCKQLINKHVTIYVNH